MIGNSCIPHINQVPAHKWYIINLLSKPSRFLSVLFLWMYSVLFIDIGKSELCPLSLEYHLLMSLSTSRTCMSLSKPPFNPGSNHELTGSNFRSGISKHYLHMSFPFGIPIPVLRSVDSIIFKTNGIKTFNPISFVLESKLGQRIIILVAFL